MFINMNILNSLQLFIKLSPVLEKYYTIIRWDIPRDGTICSNSFSFSLRCKLPTHFISYADHILLAALFLIFWLAWE